MLAGRLDALILSILGLVGRPEPTCNRGQALVKRGYSVTQMVILRFDRRLLQHPSYENFGTTKRVV